MKFKNILWDWNGTLMDDVGVSLNAVNIMLEKRGLPTITLEQYYEYIDTPIIKFYRHCFVMENENEDALLNEFQLNYAALAESLPVDSLTYDTVFAFRKLGVRQFVVSSCEEKLLLSWLEKYGVFNMIEGVTGAGNLYAESKIDRAKALMASYGLCPSETVFIGDTLHDYETAQALGVECMLVTYGHGAPSENKKTACVTADSLDETVKLFEK